MLNGLDLFSGIGGIAIALAPWVRPIAYCEIEQKAQGFLLSEMGAGKLPIAPIWDDVQTLTREIISGHSRGTHDDGESIDIISGGFPCQNISMAGNGKGLEGERSKLFWEVVRLTGELRPEFVFLENVPAITTRGGLEVIGAFASMGYGSRWCVIPSGHDLSGFKGERWFCLAKTESQRLETSWQRRGIQKEESLFTSEVFSIGMDCERPTVEPSICGISYGLPYRMDRIKALGNAVVPIQARKAFKILMGIE